MRVGRAPASIVGGRKNGRGTRRLDEPPRDGFTGVVSEMAEKDIGLSIDHPLAIRVRHERDSLADLVADLERIEYITDLFLLMKRGDATYVPDFGKNPEFGQMKNDIVRITGKIQARIETLGQLNGELKETFGI
jgi:hypothetical protein